MSWYFRSYNRDYRDPKHLLRRQTLRAAGQLEEQIPVSAPQKAPDPRFYCRRGILCPVCDLSVSVNTFLSTSLEE